MSVYSMLYARSFAMLSFVVHYIIATYKFMADIYHYIPELFHWYLGNHMIVPVQCGNLDGYG